MTAGLLPKDPARGQDAQISFLYESMCTDRKPDATKVTLTLARLIDRLNFVSVPKVTHDGKLQPGIRSIVSRTALIKLVEFSPCRGSENGT